MRRSMLASSYFSCKKKKLIRNPEVDVLPAAKLKRVGYTGSREPPVISVVLMGNLCRGIHLACFGVKQVELVLLYQFCSVASPQQIFNVSKFIHRNGASELNEYFGRWTQWIPLAKTARRSSSLQRTLFDGTRCFLFSTWFSYSCSEWKQPVYYRGCSVSLVIKWPFLQLWCV